MDGGRSSQGRIAGGYGALVEFLTAGCRDHGVAIHLGSVVSAIEAGDGKSVVRCTKGDIHACDAVILSVPLPLLKEIMLPPAERERAEAATRIGFQKLKAAPKYARNASWDWDSGDRALDDYYGVVPT